jgi:hypothetical protein
MRTSTEITQKEKDAFHKFCTEHRIVTDDEVGRANGDLIGEYIVLTWNEDITPRTLAVALEKLRDRIVFYSAAQLAYDKEYNALTKAQQDAFGSWWHRQGKILVLENDEGFSNAKEILKWCQGRNFDARTFDLAVSNLAGSRGLHFVRQSTFRGGKHSGSDASFMSKSDTNLSARDHAARRAAEAAAASGTPAPRTDYRKLSEEIKGNTHSKTLQIQRMTVTRPGTSETDWEATYAARRRAAGL